MRKSDALSAVALAVVVGLAGCGGGGNNPGAPSTPAPTPTPTPTPTPEATQPAPCLLTAPTADCSTRSYPPVELAGALQQGFDAAAGTPGVMYTGVNRIYDVLRFREKVVDTLTRQNLCGAWDYGDPAATEIFVRSADGCKVEQYAAISSGGGIRNTNKKTLMWEGNFDTAVPPPRPNYARYGDTTCSLPGDRSTYCFSIRNTQGEFGPDVYQLMVQVLAENPELFDQAWFLPGAGQGNPAQLRLPGWKIKNVDGYIAAVEAKIRANGFCGYVQGGDVLLVKSVAKGNVFHEEIDIVQNPPTGGSFVSFSIHDRCHDAGF